MKFTSALARLTLVAFLVMPCSAPAQTTPAINESNVRQAVGQLVETWNRHDVKAFAGLLTPDIEYGIPGREKHLQGRDEVAAYLPYYIRNHDRTLEIVSVKIGNDGTATALMHAGLFELPLRDGKYARVFAPSRAIGRWRLSEGKLLMFYFNSLRSEVDEIVKSESLEDQKQPR